MKILFFIESLGSGGKERRLVELIKGLSYNSSVNMEVALIKDKIHYKDIDFVDVKLHLLLRSNMRKDPSIFWKFFKIAKIMKPDLIHVWGNMTAIYAIPTSVFLNIPLINNQITDAPSKIDSSILSHKLSFPFSKKILANSNAGLNAYNAPKEKSLVIYNGFDFNRIKNIDDVELIRKKFKIKTDFIVGMVASFSDKKDYNTYLKAADLVIKKIKNISFLCVGQGDDSQFREIVSPINREKVLFLGKQNNVESIMNICNIGVLTTYTEGISNSLLEFMALGKPVVVTGGGGCSELIENNENGFILEQGDFLGLSEKIIELIEKKETSKKFGEKSVFIVKNKFGIRRMINEYNELYQSVI